VFVPHSSSGKVEQINLKIDSKGRLYIPAEIRKEIGDTATLKKTSEGYLIIPGKREEFLEEFRKVITSEPRRTGQPECCSPEKMKSIWCKAK
jgi:bifunctional DNA-binding transcriptional regulator/antitoxin component of YhaV-PrlF toxin-antitoxin module